MARLAACFSRRGARGLAGYYRKASGKSGVSYNDAVNEAICFGWIDSTVRKVDKERRAQRFTPRQPGSPLSEMNKERARRMTEAGLQTVGDLSSAGLVIILAALQADEETWRNFLSLPEATGKSVWDSLRVHGGSLISFSAGLLTSSK